VTDVEASMFYIQTVRIQWRWVHQVGRSTLVTCWRVRLTVSLSRVTHGLTATVSLCLPLVRQRCSVVGSTWPAQPPATSQRHVVPATASVETPPVS